MKRRLVAGAVVIAAAAVLIAAGGCLSSPSYNTAPLMLEAATQPTPTLGQVRVRFFGTSTVLIGDGETALMVDGFFSRPGLLRMAFGKLAPNQERIAAALEKGEVDRLDAILVAHSHHDHALDSAAVAQRTGGVVVGSTSTANVARGQGFPACNLRLVDCGEKMSFGKFVVTFFQLPHAPGSLGPGFLDRPLRSPARVFAFKEGENYAFHLQHPSVSVLIVPGANYMRGLFADVEADVVLLGIGALGKQRCDFVDAVWRESVTVLRPKPKLVIPIHWDDFSRPLAEPLVPLRRFMDNMPRSMCRLRQLALHDDVDLRFLPLYDEVVLPPSELAAEPALESCEPPPGCKRLD